MLVYLELSGWFKRYTNGRTRLEIDISPGTTAIQAITLSGIPEAEVGLITVFDEKVAQDHMLSHKDIIRVYPVVIGG
jgi:putative ubiquitin-RnfH superfamily antitoxin RatB of RatAB toxin-antitoxin module